MSTEVFEAKYGEKLAELALKSGASMVGESRGLHQENQSASQEGSHFAHTTRKLSIMLNYVLDLSDYTGMSNVLSNAYSIMPLVRIYMYLVGRVYI